MFRKRRQPAPYMRMPGAPYNPITGGRAPLGPAAPRGTTIATFQVIGDAPFGDSTTQDTHDNYVVCRGFEPDVDPAFRYLHDPYSQENTEPISVAKPYSLRGTFPYKRGQVVIAARIPTKLGINQGKSATTIGHPNSLDEATQLLIDDNGVKVAWIDISYVPAQTGRWRNFTGETCPAFGVVSITDRIVPVDGTLRYYECEKVEVAYKWNYLVNGPSDVENDGYGYGSFLDGTDGEVLCDGSPAIGERWGPVPFSFELGQHRPGFHILGGAHDGRCTARQIPPGEVRVKTDVGIAAGGTGTVSMYGGAAGTTDLGLTVAITNGSSVAWGAGKYGWATFDAGGLIFGAPHQT